jgi:Terminase large subunit, T4likevirus-type, N-terminal
MITSAMSTLERRAAVLHRQIDEVRQVSEAVERPKRTAVEMASDIGLTLDAWQVRALETTSRDVILLASRQAGKSTVAGVAALHEAVYEPGSLTLIVSPSERQSKRLLRSVRRLYQHVREVSPPTIEGILSIELKNGSEIHALPGSEGTIRGFSAVDLLILDEGARIEDPLYEAVRPMLAVSNGQLMALSTPFGKRGWFYEEWEHGQGWHRERVTAADCPRISPAYLERERNRIGDWLFEQEYGCEFKDANDQLFSHELVEAALSDDFAPLFEGITA